MKLPQFRTTAALTILLGFATAHAKAEPIEFSFGSGAYTATYDKFGVAARFGTLFASSPTTTSVGLFMTSPPLEGAHWGASDLIATQINTFYNAPGTGAYSFRPPDSHYTLHVILEDVRWSVTGQLEFPGYFTGTISPTKVNIGNTFLGPTTQSLLLGPDLYTVTIGPFLPPSAPNSPDLGSIGAHVEVRQVKATPEPSTLVLAGMAIIPLGLAAWRRHRRIRSPQPSVPRLMARRTLP
jgi:hypothetical protein